MKNRRNKICIMIIQLTDNFIGFIMLMWTLQQLMLLWWTWHDWHLLHSRWWWHRSRMHCWRRLRGWRRLLIILWWVTTWILLCWILLWILGWIVRISTTPAAAIVITTPIWIILPIRWIIIMWIILWVILISYSLWSRWPKRKKKLVLYFDIKIFNQ